MKKLVLLAIVLLASIQISAQTDGMSYQAVILNPKAQEIPGADVSGNVLPNKSLSVRFTITSSAGSVVYQEVHNTVTDGYGMINLVIGHGSFPSGDFTEIVWDGDRKDLKVEINLDGNYNLLSNQMLLFIPYAYHRDVIASGDLLVAGKVGFSDNLVVDGTTDLNKTLSVNNGSASNLSGVLKVDGATDLNSSLAVNNGSASNLSGTLKVDGATDLNSSLAVNNGSASNLSGTLKVDGATDLNSSLSVKNGSPTILTGILKVDGATTLNNTLTIANAKPSHLTGLLRVDGATTIDDDLIVTGTTTLEDLNIKKFNVKTNNTAHVASFENTNDGDGDGIIIKLGRARASDGLPDVGQYEENADAASMTKYKQLLSAETSLSQKGVLIGEIAIEMAKEELKFIAGLAVGIGNKIINFLNVEILRKIGWDDVDPLWELMVALNNECDLCVPDDFTDWLKGKLVIPGFQFPDFPSIDLSDFGIVEVDITKVSFWGVPAIQLGDIVSNPLNNKNEFISFADKNSQRMGAIKAQSVENWTYNYLNPVFIYQLKSAFTSTTFDKKHSRWHFQDLISDALTSYKNIGVEYSSGNGDYAEWLERIDVKEAIGTGDIVGVKGGKITRDLTDAEQVMAVSERPIVLGNTPQEGKEYLGNNIAFMGQIPVKVMGIVNPGDYIVGKGIVKGYGVAINPIDMTIDDFKMTVGRAWDSNLNAGPKMVNTVIGIHNGDYINILKRYEARFNESESRLQSVEAKVDVLTDFITKKSF